MRLSALCRGCSASATDAQLLLTALRLRFTECTGLQIENDDGLPLNICNECVNNVNHCYDFINTCKRTDHNLRELLNNKDDPDNLHNQDPSSVKKESSLFVIVEELPITHDDNHRLSIDDSPPSPDSQAKDDNFFSDVENNTENDIIPELNMRKSKNSTKRKKRVKTKIMKFRNTNPILSVNKSDKDSNTAGKKNYSCPVCDKAFVGKSLFKLHMSEEHPNFKKFICTYCPKAFTKSQYLKQHLITHSSKRSFACTMCPKDFKQQCQLIQHRKSHSKVKPYKCDKCDMSFHLRNGMISHSKQHDNNVQHLCHLCGQGFAQLGNLMVHMRIHTGEKPYACSSCSFRCSVQSGMRRHERTHANLRPHVCSFCQKTFNNTGSLARHARIHTGELPYKCSLCPQAFIDSWKRKNHLVKVHQMALVDIPRMFPGRKKVYTNDSSKDDSSYIKAEPS